MATLNDTMGDRIGILSKSFQTEMLYKLVHPFAVQGITSILTIISNVIIFRSS